MLESHFSFFLADWSWLQNTSTYVRHAWSTRASGILPGVLNWTKFHRFMRAPEVTERRNMCETFVMVLTMAGNPFRNSLKDHWTDSQQCLPCSTSDENTPPSSLKWCHFIASFCAKLCQIGWGCLSKSDVHWFRRGCASHSHPSDCWVIQHQQSNCVIKSPLLHLLAHVLHVKETRGFSDVLSLFSLPLLRLAFVFPFVDGPPNPRSSGGSDSALRLLLQWGCATWMVTRRWSPGGFPHNHGWWLLWFFFLFFFGLIYLIS